MYSLLNGSFVSPPVDVVDVDDEDLGTFRFLYSVPVFLLGDLDDGDDPPPPLHFFFFFIPPKLGTTKQLLPAASPPLIPSLLKLPVRLLL